MSILGNLILRNINLKKVYDSTQSELQFSFLFSMNIFKKSTKRNFNQIIDVTNKAVNQSYLNITKKFQHVKVDKKDLALFKKSDTTFFELDQNDESRSNSKIFYTNISFNPMSVENNSTNNLE